MQIGLVARTGQRKFSSQESIPIPVPVTAVERSRGRWQLQDGQVGYPFFFGAGSLLACVRDIGRQRAFEAKGTPILVDLLSLAPLPNGPCV